MLENEVELISCCVNQAESGSEVSLSEVESECILVGDDEVGTTCASIAEECCGSACSIADVGKEVALGCNAETLSYSHIVLLTELPDLVVEEILKNLNISSLLSLRSTCHTTKIWVDKIPNFLSNFHLNISSNEEMVHLLSSSKKFPVASKWRNVSLPEKGFTSYPCFPSFVSLFSSHLTSLHLQHFDGGLAEILFLSSCESLEHLKIDQMDLRQNPALVVASDKMLKAKCPKLLDIFTELRGLQIGLIYFNEVKQLSFYQTFLQRCKKLRVVNVPRPQGPPSISWETVKQIQLKQFIGPIHEYFHKKPMTKPIKSDIEILDVEGLFSKHFPAVAETCVQIGASTKFINVNEKQVKYLFTRECNILQRIVTLKEKIDDRRPLENWEGLEELYVRTSRCDVRKEYPEGFIGYPSLIKLSIVMDSRSRDDHNFEMLKRLIDLLVRGRERHNLREFVINWPLFSHDTPGDYVRASDFVGGFGNLTKLRLHGWTVPDDDFLLVIQILGKLKVLVLEECINLTDWGLLGSPDLERPAIINLKDLKRLEIKNRNNRGYITDECFERAFAHMRLKYFIVESFQVSKKGYEFLAEGEFSGTIEKLPCPRLLPTQIQTEEEFAVFIAAKFPNVIL